MRPCGAEVEPIRDPRWVHGAKPCGCGVQLICVKFSIATVACGMDVADAKRLKVLEDENRKLKQLVGELTLDNQGLKYLLTKKF